MGIDPRTGKRITPPNRKVPAAARRGRGKRNDYEGDEQAQLIIEFRQSYPELEPFLIHNANGGSRKNRFEGWRLKAQGVRKGVSDLLLTLMRGGYGGLWIEFKASPPHTARVTDEQIEWCVLMREQGYAACVAVGTRQAMEIIELYLAGGGAEINQRPPKP